jgi:hypothetical protein
MRTFGTFEKDVDGMIDCVKRKIVVQAVQINEEFRVESLEGDYAQGNSGDYLMTGVEGEHYICEQKIFNKTYDFI